MKELTADLDIIKKLGDNPGVDDGLSTDALKAKFDEAGNIIKDYINNYLIAELDKLINVDALLKDILDTTLSKADKAANAKAAGDALRNIRTFIDRAIRGGDYVLPSGGQFAASITGETTIRLSGGEGVMLGNLFSADGKDISVSPGTYGLNRSDLICMHCEKDSSGALSFSYAVKEGQNTSAVDPIDPEYAQEDINGDGRERDVPLYRVRFTGYDITSLDKLFRSRMRVDELTQGNTITIPAGSWGSGQATVSAPGVTAGNTVLVSYAEESYASYTESGIRCTGQGEGTLTFVCESQPDGAVSVNVVILN